MSASPPTLAEAAKALADLVGQGTRVGMDLLGGIKLPTLGKATCSCDIPPPCWAPQPLGEVTTRVCPGNQAVVTLSITNCGKPRRTISVVATDADVSVDPKSLQLEPFEEGDVVLSLAIPAGAEEGESRTILVWVRGCKEHVLRWRVETTCRNTSCCVEVEVEDCPDLVHHWYDHFYCERPCVHDR